MCLIIRKTAEQEISTEFLTNVSQRNNDGYGLTWLNRRGKPAMWKTLDFNAFLNQYQKLKHKELLIHFRYTTHGLTNYDNAHPHFVIPDVYMVHNGVFSKYNKTACGDESDTVLFIKEVVRPMLQANGGASYLRTDEFHTEIVKHINGSRIAFMDEKGVVIVAPETWHTTLSGLQVSNLSMFSVDNPNQGIGYNSRRSTYYYSSDASYGKYTHNVYDGYEEESYCNTKSTPPMSLAVNNNAPSQSRALTVKDVKTPDIDIDNYLWLADATDSEIEELISIEAPEMARLIKALLTEHVEYGYSAENFRLSSK